MEHDPLCPVGEYQEFRMISGVVLPASTAEACEVCWHFARVREDERSKWQGARSGGVISSEQAERIGANIGQLGCVIP